MLVWMLLMVAPFWSYAQCAMCRTQVENNVSHGDTSLAAGLNLGIIYLFVTPYLVIGVVAYFWYRNAKSNVKKRSIERRAYGQLSQM